MKISPIAQFDVRKNKSEKNSLSKNHTNVINASNYVNFSAENIRAITFSGNISFKGSANEEKTKTRQFTKEELLSKGYSIVEIKNGKLSTTQDKIILTSTEDLIALSNTPEAWQGKEFVLTDNIDLSKVENWTSIGDNKKPFKGIFNGNSYAISGLKIDNPKVNNQGLFGQAISSKFRNVKLDGVEVTAREQVGSLVGYVSESKITNCQSSGRVNGEKQIGGLIGTSCENVIVNSGSKVKVVGSKEVGGIAGFDKFSKILSCYSKTAIRANEDVGGIVGYGLNSEIKNASFIGTVLGKERTGTLIGWGDSLTSVTNSFSFKPNQQSESVNELIGYSPEGHVSNCLKENELANYKKFDNWSKSIWDIKEGRFPRLRAEIKHTPAKELIEEEQGLYVRLHGKLSSELMNAPLFNVNQFNAEGRTPLFFCTNEAQIENLIKKGADIFHKDLNGQSPMHRYCETGNTGIVQFLSENGASHLAKDNKGLTPLDLAKRNNHREIEKIFTVGTSGFSKIIGMSDLKAELKNGVISPLTNPRFKERGIKPLDGIILHGLPRVGKTYIATALAEELDRPIYTIKGTDFGSKYQHESSTQLAEKFNSVLSNRNAVLLLDDIEAMAPDRSVLYGDNTVVDLNEQVNVLLDKLVECRKRGILVIAATNHPEKMDKAVKDRFTKTFFVPPPDMQARIGLFRNELSNVPADDRIDIKELAQKTKNYTAEKITTVVNEANIISANEGSDNVTMKHLLDALKKIKAPITQGDLDKYRLNIPTTETAGASEASKTITFADVAGMREVKAKLEDDIILPLKNPKLYDEVVGEAPNGHLLYGPPGCGKTWVAKALAGETGRTFIEMDSSIGGDPSLIKKVFDEAKYNSPSILFIDEIEAFVPPRGTGATTVGDNRITSEFLRQLNECSKDNVYVIAATNHPELIDDAIKRTGRFDRKTFIPPMDKEAREELFRMRFKDYKRLEEGVDFAHLADLTNNFGAAQINKITRDAKRNVYNDIIKKIDIGSKVTQQKLVEMIKETTPELTDEVVKRFKNLLK